MLQTLTSPKFLRSALPAASLGILLTAIFTIQPRAMSYFGLNLMLQYAVPIALATIAQMCIITVNDLDLSIGPFVGLVACIGATLLYNQPILGLLALAACISMIARSIGPPGTTRVIRKTMMVMPKSVGGIRRSLRKKYDRIWKT